MRAAGGSLGQERASWKPAKRISYFPARVQLNADYQYRPRHRSKQEEELRSGVGRTSPEKLIESEIFLPLSEKISVGKQRTS